MSHFIKCVLTGLIVCTAVIPFIVRSSKKHPLNKRLSDLNGMSADDFYTSDHRKVS